MRQSRSIRADLEALTNRAAQQSKPATPGELGNVSASLSSFNKALDEYASLAKQEIVPKKQEEAQERVKKFRGDLSEFREGVERLRKDREEEVARTERAELFSGAGAAGRRGGYSSTPENPYANATSTTTHSTFQPRAGHASSHNTALGSGDVDRESHALREQNFFSSTNSALDDYIARGQAVLGDLGQQREMMKNTQRRLYGVANTLGVSGDTIRMVERRAREDKWIFVAGVLVFFGFCWLVLHYLR